MPEISIQKTKSFVIPDGEAASNSIRSYDQWDNTIVVYADDVTDSGVTYKYQVSPNNNDWYDLLDDAAAAIIPPLEGKAKVLDAGMFVFVRIAASGNVTADRTWFVSAMT